MRKIQQIVTIILFLALQFIFFFPSKAQINTIPGLELWLRADSGVVIDNGQHIKQWNDLSPNHVVFLQNDSNARPFYQSSFLNNKPSVFFDGNNDFLTGDFIINKPNITIFIIEKILNFVQYSGLVSLYNSTQTNDWQNQNTVVCFDINPPFLLSERSGNTIKYSQEFLNIPLLLSAEYSSTYLKSFVNTNHIDSVFNNFTDFDINKIILGARYDNYNASLFTQAEFAELVIYDTILTKQQKKQVETYLMDKYAPPVRLPNDTVLTSFCPFMIIPHGYFTAYQWNTGETSDTIIVKHSGYYNVTATDIFGRQSSDSIFVQFPGNIFQTHELLCLNDSIVLQTGLTYPDYHFLWQNSDTTPDFTIHTPGQYYVHITDSLGCIYFSDTIHVQYNPFSFENVLSDSTRMCLGDSLLAFHPQAVSYHWSTGASTPFILPQNTGWYYVTLTNATGCKLPDSCHVFIKGQKPQPQIDKFNLCSQRLTLYSGSSTGNIVQWQWTLQDSLLYSGLEIEHLYNQAGIYHTILHVVDSNTCEGYAFSTDTIHDSPHASFIYNSGCQGQHAVFTSHAQCMDSIATYNWNLDNNLFSGEIISANLNLGNHLVKHWVVSEYGCTDTTLLALNISNNSLVQADANYPSQGMNCIDNPIVFSWNNHGYLSCIEVSFNSNFSQINYRSTKNLLQQCSLSSIPYDTVVYWRIWTYNNCNDSLSSPVYSFSRYRLHAMNGLSLWLASDSGVVKDINNKVSEWHDISGNNHIFNQTNSNFQPSYISAIDSFSYKPIVFFDGNNDFLTGDFIINKPDITIFIIEKILNFVPYSGLVSLYNSTQTNDWQNQNTVVCFDINPPFLLSERSGNTIKYSQEFLNIPLLLSAEYSSTYLKSFVNTNHIDSVFNNFTDFDINKIILGARYDNYNASFYTQAEFAELVIYDTILTKQQKKQVETYLMDKYAPPVRLPNDTVLTSFCPFMIIPHGYFTAYQWNTGETSDTIIVKHSGYYNVTATDIFGRQSSDSIFVKFPEAGFAQTTRVCAGDSVLITSALGNVVQYSWSDGNTRNYDYLKNENRYFVTITDNFSCSTVDSFFIDVDSLSLYPLFLNDTAHLCEGNLLGFNQNTLPIVHYQWQPTGDTLAHTTVSQSGFYTVSVTDIVGCQHKDSIYIDILGKAPIASFSASHTCKGDSTFFNDLSIPLDVSPINYWQWIINSDTLYEPNPSYLFSHYGTYSIILNVGTASGCFQTNEQNFTVFPLPTSNFSLWGFCQQQQTSFTQQSNIPFGNLTTFYWTFGDGQNSYLENPVHIYPNQGDYTVTLVTESDEGCVDSISKQVEIKYTPQAGFDVSPSCNNNPTFFADTSKTLNIFPIIQWQWSFGDQNHSTSQNPSHIYTGEGSYNAQLIIKILDGCTDTVSKNITVSSKPNAGFTTDIACVGQIMNAVDQSTITNGSITSWTWYINNNYYSQEQNPTITPYLEGILPVTLIVESNTYCRDTVSKNILVHRKPIVSFNAQPIYGAVPLTVDFENLSELGNSYWSFGDGFNSLLTNPTHIYQDTGLFQTYLVLTNLYGCKDSVEKSIMVVPNIVDLAVQQVSFTESNSLINITAKIANLGTIPIMNPMLTFYTNEQQRITEVVNTTLFSSDILNYTFHGKISTQYANPSYICVEGNLSQPLIETTLLNNVSCCVTQNQDSFLNLYPNPAEENLNVLFQLTEDQEIRVQLVNSIGKEIIDQTVQATNGFNQITIDVSGFSQGVYMIVIHAKNTTFVKMFMKA